MQNLPSKRSPLTAAVFAGMVGLAAAAPAQAFNFDLGEEVSGSLDITLGYANEFRTEDSQAEDMTPDLATGSNRGANYLSEARTPNAGDMTSQVFSATFELGLDWRNFGLVSSVAAKYDTEIMDRQMDRGLLAGTGVQWSESSRKYAGNPVDLLDAYVWGSFEVGENPLEVRIGKQVVNWGEGLFFLGGISTQVALNINKLVTPGAELKEAYIGNRGIFAQLGIGDASSVEAYAFDDFNRAEFPTQGTFYGSDLFFRGGAEAQGVDNVGLAVYGLDGATLGTPVGIRGTDIPAKDSGQWGVNFKTTIGDTEYGIYYSRYHSVFPFVKLDPAGAASFYGLSQFYPEDLDMYGFSWSTTLGTWSFAGEIAYRPDDALFGNLGTAFTSTGNLFRNDTIHASANGIWLGGPTIAGIDAQYAIYQIGVDHISGDRSQLAPQNTITRDDKQTALSATVTPDKTAIGAAVNWGGTWQAIRPGTDLTLDLFVQQGLKGNSHFWGNFAENQTLYAASLIANIGNAWEASMVYSGMAQKTSDYEDGDTVSFAVNYKF